MTEEAPPPVGTGHFIWSHFPKRESPAQPSDERHIALCIRRFRHKTQGYILAAVFTTTRPRGDRPKAKGEIEISKEEAVKLGQQSAFRIDCRRMAALPLNADFFPDLEEQDHGIRGRSERLANAAFKLFQELAANEPELIDLLGPPEARQAIFGRK
ncbi:MAG: hypothetical protein ACLP1D_16340 [Xanthobacteraceae bacterium]|jgi:hypothetical protein